MPKTTLKQRFLLLAFGLLLTIVLLEVGLRIAGGVVQHLQERHNQISPSGLDYRILCLGESTTALGGEDSYPSQLEKLLNEQSKKKFTVINKGVIATTTDRILASADENLNLYKPQLVIIMMGINDRFYYKEIKGPSWLWRFNLYLQSFRVYKLINLIHEHLTHPIKNNEPPSEDLEFSQTKNTYQKTEVFLKTLIAGFLESFQSHLMDAEQFKRNNRLDEAKREYEQAQSAAIAISSGYVDLANRYRQQGLFNEAQDCLQKASTFDPSSVDVYQQWGEVYLAMGNGKEASRAFKTALAMNPNKECILGLARALHQQQDEKAMLIYLEYLKLNPKDYWGYIELAQWFRERKLYSQAEINLNRALEINPSLDRAYLDMGQLLGEQERYKEEEAIYLKRLAVEKKSFRVYQALSVFYQKQGQDQLAQEYFKNGLKLGLTQYRFETLVNYDALLNKVLNRGIPVIVMQYPLRSIDPLKDYLGSRKSVTYVENKQNFKNALQSGQYSYYFKDTFGDDFGHCTRWGNELIAKNLVGTILKIVEGSNR